MRIGVLACFLGGCSLFGAPPSAPPEPEPPAEPPGPERCADWHAPPKKRWPTVAELRSTLGQPVDSPAVARLEKILGRGELRADYVHRWYAFMHAGVWLRLERTHGGEQVERVQLFGRGEHRYGGELPESLHFSQDHAELERRLGGGDEPAKCSYGIVPCVYTERGLAVDATGVALQPRCVSQVDLFRGLRTDQVAFDDLGFERQQKDGAHGIALRARPRFGHVDGSSSVTIRFRLRTADGAAVREARWRLVEDWEDTPGALEARSSVSYLTSGAQDFIPFVAFDLPEGTHELVAELSATRQRTNGLFSSPAGEPEPLEVVGTHAMPVRLDMPPVTEVRFGVRSVALAAGEYDDVERTYGIAVVATLGASAMFVPPQRWKLPDPMWEVTLAGSTAYRSSARQDVLRAAWSGKTPWLRLTPGDQLTLSIIDEDTTNDGESLETLTYDADTLAAAAAKPWVSEGSVRQMRLSSVETR